jgi:hypothetical protein
LFIPSDPCCCGNVERYECNTGTVYAVVSLTQVAVLMLHLALLNRPIVTASSSSLRTAQLCSLLHVQPWQQDAFVSASSAAALEVVQLPASGS